MELHEKVGAEVEPVVSRYGFDMDHRRSRTYPDGVGWSCLYVYRELDGFGQYLLSAHNKGGKDANFYALTTVLPNHLMADDTFQRRTRFGDRQSKELQPVRTYAFSDADPIESIATLLPDLEVGLKEYVDVIAQKDKEELLSDTHVVRFLRRMSDLYEEWNVALLEKGLFAILEELRSTPTYPQLKMIAEVSPFVVRRAKRNAVEVEDSELFAVTCIEVLRAVQVGDLNEHELTDATKITATQEPFVNLMHMAYHALRLEGGAISAERFRT